MASNNAPKCKWVVEMQAEWWRQHRLYVEGSRTPYFIHTGKVSCHRVGGDVHSLLAAGESKRGSALKLSGGRRLDALKSTAERHAFERMGL